MLLALLKVLIGFRTEIADCLRNGETNPSSHVLRFTPYCHECPMSVVLL